MQRGLVAALIVGIVCAVMGAFVVLKGLAFIGDAVSHAAFPGLVIAYLIGDPAVRRRRDRGGLDGPGDRRRVAARQPALRHRGRRAVRGHVRARRAPVQHDPAATSPTCSATCSATSSASARPTSSRSRSSARSCSSSCWCCARSSCTRRSTRPAPRRRVSRSTRLEYLLLALLGVTIVVSIQAVGIILVVAMLVHAGRDRPAAGRSASTGWSIVAVGIAIVLDGRRPVRVLLPERRVGRGDRAHRDACCSRSPSCSRRDPGSWRLAARRLSPADDLRSCPGTVTIGSRRC